MLRGTFRKRTPKKTSMRSYSGGYYDENGKKQDLPNDLVDYYLKERFNIDLHSHRHRIGRGGSGSPSTLSNNTPMHSETTNLGNLSTLDDEKEDQQASIIQARARILENPVYQKMPFYPYKDLLMWQEVEAQ